MLDLFGVELEEMYEIKPKYYHCREWEDLKNGMYRMKSRRGDDELILNSASLLSDEKMLYSAMMKVIDNWIISCNVQLSNINQNRRAWLGWSACCMEYGSPDFCTRQAWGLLEQSVQDRANKVADEIIKIWEERQCLKNY